MRHVNVFEAYMLKTDAFEARMLQNETKKHSCCLRSRILTEMSKNRVEALIVHYAFSMGM